MPKETSTSTSTSPSSPPLPHLLIIGSGWVGLYLAQYIDPSLYRITILSPRRTSAYTPLLASAACGLFPFSCAEESLRVKGRKCRFVKANALTVDFEGRRVRCEPAFEDEDGAGHDGEGNEEGLRWRERRFDIQWDRLVICPGCRTNTFNTPGVEKYAIFMKHVSDAMALRKKLFDQLEKASLPNVSEEEARAMLHVVIVGGGPTGVEVTAELSDLAKHELHDLYPSVAPLIQISIYDVASHILGTYDQSLYEYATERMIQNGVHIATNSIISRVDASSLHLKSTDDPVPYGLLLWVAGNKSVPFVDNLDVKKSAHGLVRVLTDSRLRVMKKDSGEEVYKDVFALGDAADIESHSLPTTAEVAVQKAKYLVKHLNQLSTPTTITSQIEPFQYTNKGLVTYIGSHDGIGEAWPIHQPWSGRRAWLSWRTGSFTWTRTWRNWIMIGLAWILNVLFGKDVMRL